MAQPKPPPPIPKMHAAAIEVLLERMAESGPIRLQYHRVRDHDGYSSPANSYYEVFWGEFQVQGKCVLDLFDMLAQAASAQEVTDNHRPKGVFRTPGVAEPRRDEQ